MDGHWGSSLEKGTYGSYFVAFGEYFIDGDRLAERFGQVHIPKLDYVSLGPGRGSCEVAYELLGAAFFLLVAVG